MPAKTFKVIPEVVNDPKYAGGKVADLKGIKMKDIKFVWSSDMKSITFDGTQAQINILKANGYAE